MYNICTLQLISYYCEYLLFSLGTKSLKKSGVFYGQAVFKVEIRAQILLDSNVTFHVAMSAFILLRLYQAIAIALFEYFLSTLQSRVCLLNKELLEGFSSSIAISFNTDATSDKKMCKCFLY